MPGRACPGCCVRIGCDGSGRGPPSMPGSSGRGGGGYGGRRAPGAPGRGAGTGAAAPERRLAPRRRRRRLAPSGPASLPDASPAPAAARAAASARFFDAEAQRRRHESARRLPCSGVLRGRLLEWPRRFLGARLRWRRRRPRAQAPQGFDDGFLRHVRRRPALPARPRRSPVFGGRSGSSTGGRRARA